MPVYQLHARSKPDGSFAAAWFDDAARLWNDERLGGTMSIADSWVSPDLQLSRPELVPTAVLFNPNAFAVSQGVRDELAAFPELEFLPSNIAGCGQFFLLHIIASIELPFGARARTAPPPSGNIVELHEFPATFDPPLSFFRVLQPEGSAARRARLVYRALYVNSAGKDAIERCAGKFLEARPK